MTKNILYIGLAALIFASCKEQPISVNLEQSNWDTSYVATVEAPQTKKLLIEEFTGVRCPNCPDGAELLHRLNAEGAFANRLCIVSVHSGILTNPIYDHEPNSIQDMRTTDGDQILQGIFGGDLFKPCAAVDRLEIGNSGSTYFGLSTTWTSMMQEALSRHASSPVNIDITGSKAGENKYIVEVKAAYTEAVEGRQALSVMLLENSIEDAQEFPNDFGMFTFDHVLRKALSPYNGLEILPGQTVKEAGQVYITRIVLNIDPNDDKQKFWKPENMEVVAFVHKTGGNDKQVYQSQTAKLIP